MRVGKRIPQPSPQVLPLLVSQLSLQGRRLCLLRMPLTMPLNTNCTCAGQLCEEGKRLQAFQHRRLRTARLPRLRVSWAGRVLQRWCCRHLHHQTIHMMVPKTRAAQRPYSWLIDCVVYKPLGSPPASCEPPPLHSFEKWGETVKKALRSTCTD